MGKRKHTIADTTISNDAVARVLEILRTHKYVTKEVTEYREDADC